MKSILYKTFAITTLLATSAMACDAEEQTISQFGSEFDLHSTQIKGGCLKACCETLKSRPQMHYTYYQNTGHFFGGSGEWAINTHGYSG